MTVRRFTLLDAMVLLAATALGLVPTGNILRNLMSEVGHVGQVARGTTVLQGRTADDLLRDPDVSWALSDGRGRFIQTGDLPGEITPRWALFGPKGPGLIRRIASLGLFLWPLLVVWGMAILALRFRRPRPSWREMAMQPGVWACVAPLVALLSLPALSRYFALEFSLLILPTSVAFTWLGLALARRWRPESSWVDRAGRGLGLGWLVLLLLGAWLF